MLQLLKTKKGKKQTNKHTKKTPQSKKQNQKNTHKMVTRETPVLCSQQKYRVLFPKRKDKALFNLFSLILGCLENIREEQGVFLPFLALL